MVDTPGVTDVRDGLVVVRWRARGGVWRWARADAGLLAEQLWRAGPVRVGARYRNRPNRHGLYFWPCTGGHVRYESARQVAALMRLDFEGRADCVGFRPVRLRFRQGAVTVGHDPDFLAVQVGGSFPIISTTACDFANSLDNRAFSMRSRSVSEPDAFDVRCELRFGTRPAARASRSVRHSRTCDW